ncbi:hypothetical protein ACFPGO_07210 [Arcanobacterium canis]|uniref:PIN domain-containing protein n=1 Tax=Arcanobacterium canis TaxID=999183 RepID=A0ABY8G2B5_9ACTO|nr:hypothetical protein [Arcanobacterium canis]WFM83444.1 hypothetical protein P7079_00240 [Arcanobacterium canis]
MFIVADTSVLLSFVCSNQHDFLVKIAKSAQTSISVPRAIEREMDRKLTTPRFKGGRKRWETLKSSPYFCVIDDSLENLTPYLSMYTGPGFDLANPRQKDLGEAIAIAHCLAQRDQDVRSLLIIDDEQGRKNARRQNIACMTSVGVLLQAVRAGLIQNRGEAKKAWIKLSKYDVHTPFEQTQLNEKKYYKQ